MKKVNDTQTIDSLTERFRKLDTEKTRVQTRLDAAQEQLEALLVQAEQEFGTRDLEQLELQLKSMEADNRKKREKYQRDLDTIEQQLQEIDEKFVDLENEQDN